MGIYKDRVASGKCGRCGKNDIELPNKACLACKNKAKAFQKAIRDTRRASSKCMSCGEELKDKRVRCGRCQDKIAAYGTKEQRNEAAKRSRHKLRKEVIEVYGGKCACCDVSDLVFLTIDHINGDGADHRRALKGVNYGAGSTSTYQWLRQHGYPPGFQVLCWNCNWAKSNGGCPHKTTDEGKHLFRQADRVVATRKDKSISIPNRIEWEIGRQFFGVG